MPLGRIIFILCGNYCYLYEDYSSMRANIIFIIKSIGCVSSLRCVKKNKAFLLHSEPVFVTSVTDW